jgi:hypothetical protein
MRLAPAAVTEAPAERSTHEPGRPRKRPANHRVRPLDDGATEQVQVIEFLLQAGDSVQPVLWLERRLLD